MNPDTNTPSNSFVPPAQQPVAPATTSLPPVPQEWPGARELYKYSKQAVLLNVGNIVLIWAVNFAVNIIVGLFLKNYTGRLVTQIISVLFSTALTYLLISGVRQNKVDFGSAMSVGFRLWLKMIGLFILVWFTAVISFLLLVIPFFFVLPGIVLMPYFLVDKDMGVIEAYKAGWNAAKGNRSKIYAIIGWSLLVALLMLTIIGIPFAIIYLIRYSAAFAVLYVMIADKTAAQPATTAAPAVPAPPVQPSQAPQV